MRCMIGRRTRPSICRRARASRAGPRAGARRPATRRRAVSTSVWHSQALNGRKIEEASARRGATAKVRFAMFGGNANVPCAPCPARTPRAAGQSRSAGISRPIRLAARNEVNSSAPLRDLHPAAAFMPAADRRNSAGCARRRPTQRGGGRVSLSRTREREGVSGSGGSGRRACPGSLRGGVRSAGARGCGWRGRGGPSGLRGGRS